MSDLDIIREIVNRIKIGELTIENDVRRANGFWDLACDITDVFGKGVYNGKGFFILKDELRDFIYQSLWCVYKSSITNNKK